MARWYYYYMIVGVGSPPPPDLTSLSSSAATTNRRNRGLASLAYHDDPQGHNPAPIIRQSIIHSGPPSPTATTSPPKVRRKVGAAIKGLPYLLYLLTFFTYLLSYLLILSFIYVI